MRTRYDLKDSGTTIQLEATEIKLHSASEMTLDAARDVLLQKAVRRQLSPKIFDYGRVEEASRGHGPPDGGAAPGAVPGPGARDHETPARPLPKLKTQIQGDAVRVTGKSKDELQTAIRSSKKAETDRNWPVPLQFVNYR